ncbi:PTPRZ1 (predicted) [Pycnogonum litorale]
MTSSSSSIFHRFLTILWILLHVRLTLAAVETLLAVGGENITLPCRGIESDDGVVLMLEWYKDDDKLVQLINDETILVEMSRHMGLQARTYALMFFRVKYEDSGSYRCVVNSNDDQNQVIRLLVQDVPDPPPSGPMFTGFTSRSINLSWDEPIDTKNSPVLHYVIHTRVGKDGDWDLDNPIRTDNNKTSWHIVDLLPYTVYSFQVTAVNKIGPSRPSEPSFRIVTLKEAPVGKPTITEIYNTSSNSVIVKWVPPPNSTLSGDLRGYKLSHRRRDGIGKINVKEGRAFYGLNEITLKNLEVFTQYIVSLLVYNSVGDGPKTTVSVMTDEGVPSQPTSLSIEAITGDSVRLKWRPPEPANGIIVAYKVYYVNNENNMTFSQEVKPVHSQMEFLLKFLSTHTRYKLYITALTKTQEGNPSDIVDFQTDVVGPSEPKIVNLSCNSTDTIYVQWLPPRIIFNQVDMYFVNIRSEHVRNFQEIMVAVNYTFPDHSLLITNLTENTLYEIKIQGASFSIVNEEKLYRGKMSESKKVILRKKCWGSNLTKGEAYVDNSINAGIVAGIIFATFCLLLSILSFVLWRKYFQASYYYLDDPPFSGFMKKTSGETYGKHFQSNQ